MEATYHSTAQHEPHRSQDGTEHAVYRNDEQGVYAVATSMNGAPGVPTPAALFIELVTRNAGSLNLLLSAEEDGAVGARVKRGMTQLFGKASELVRRLHSADGSAIASATLVVLNGEQAAVAHVGDTRCYLVREGRVVRLSRDHVPTGEEDSVAAAGGLTRAIGQAEPLQPDVACFATRGDDYVILTSAAVHHCVTEEELVEVTAMVDSADRVVNAIMNLARRRTELELSCAAVDIEQEVVEAPVPVPGDAVGESSDTPAAAGAGPVRAIPLTPSEPPPVEELEDVGAHIKRHPLFVGMPAEQVDAMIALLTEVPYDEGHRLYEEGRPMTELYLVTRGVIRLEREGKAVGSATPGTFLAEIALIQGMQHRDTAIVETPATVLALTQMGLAKLTVTDPQFAVLLYHNLARKLANEAV